MLVRGSESDDERSWWSDGFGPTLLNGKPAVPTLELSGLDEASKLSRAVFLRANAGGIGRWTGPGRSALSSIWEGPTDEVISSLQEMNRLALQLIWKMNDPQRRRLTGHPDTGLAAWPAVNLEERRTLLGMLIDYATAARYRGYQWQCAEWYREAGEFQSALECVETYSNIERFERLQALCERRVTALARLTPAEQSPAISMDDLCSFVPQEQRVAIAVAYFPQLSTLPGQQ